jgi:hypothetical protein
MADSFVDVEFTSDPETLADDAVARLQERWDGWEPNEADQEVVMIETLAPMAAEATGVASNVPAAAFRTFGTKLADEPYIDGLFAVASLTFAVVPEGSPARAVGQAVTIEAGFEVLIDNVSFATDDEVTVPAGQTTAVGVPATCTIEGSDYNDLPGDTVTPMVAERALVAVTLDAPTTGGSDEEGDDDYQDRLSRTMQLSAKTIVTLRDFELWALVRYPTTIGRAVARHLGARHVELTLAGFDGLPVAAPVKAALVADYAQYRLANTTVDTPDATYTTVNVDYAVKLYPSADQAAAIAAVNAVLATELSPATWGSPKYTRDRPQPVWFNDPVVRRNKLIDLIGDVEGVDYVDTLTLSVPGGVPAPNANGDLTLPGAVALPEPGVFTGSTV